MTKWTGLVMHTNSKLRTSWARPAYLAAGVMLVLALVMSGGCRFGPRNFENENDRLRRENLELRRHVEELSQRLDRRVGELESLRQRLERVDAEVMPDAEAPTLSRLAMGRYSGGVDTTNDGVDDLIRVYLRTLDQEGRVMPVAGRAVMQVVAIPDEGEPWTLGQRVYEPREFSRAWRSGFLGSHYTLELQLPPKDLPERLSEVAVRVTFTQAQTGVEMRTQQAFRIRPPSAAVESVEASGDVAP